MCVVYARNILRRCSICILYVGNYGDKKNKNVGVKMEKIKPSRKRVLRKCCWMCLNFYKSQNMNGTRICIMVKKEVTKDTVIKCKKFETCENFYCRKRGMTVSTKACINIRKRKRKNQGSEMLSPEHYRAVYAICKEKCSQGRALEWASTKFGAQPVTRKRIKLLKRMKPRRSTNNENR